MIHASRKMGEKKELIKVSKGCVSDFSEEMTLMPRPIRCEGMS